MKKIDFFRIVSTKNTRTKIIYAVFTILIYSHEHKGRHQYLCCHEKRPMDACGWVGKWCGRFFRGKLKQDFKHFFLSQNIVKNGYKWTAQGRWNKRGGVGDVGGRGLMTLIFLEKIFQKLNVYQTYFCSQKKSALLFFCESYINFSFSHLQFTHAHKSCKIMAHSWF